VEEGLTNDLYDRPLHPYTKALLSAIPDVSATHKRAGPQRIVLKGDPPSPARPPSGCHFHTRCPHAQARCVTEMPALRPIDCIHTARCHYAEQLAT
jgi:oligopeptide/dipeptide ABC transporter ATP-binding protein